MKEQAPPANSMTELPIETREFLARLSKTDIRMVEEGLGLMLAVRRVGVVMKWFLVGVLGIAVGTVMFYESMVKIIGWLRG